MSHVQGAVRSAHIQTIVLDYGIVILRSSSLITVRPLRASESTVSRPSGLPLYLLLR